MESMLERKICAYHEAGHTVASMALGCYFKNVNLSRINAFRPADLIDAAIVFYSGPVALHKSRGYPILMCGGEHDAELAYDAIYKLVLMVSSKKSHPCNFRILHGCFQSAEQLINDNWVQVELIAKHLLKKKKLSYADTMRILYKHGGYDNLKVPNKIKLKN